MTEELSEEFKEALEYETPSDKEDAEADAFWNDIRPCTEFLALPEAVTHACLNCGETYLLIESNGEVRVI